MTKQNTTTESYSQPAGLPPRRVSRAVDHLWIVLVALVIVLAAYITLVCIHGTNPKLMDGVLILVGAIAALSRQSP